VPELTPFEMNSLLMWLDREDGKRYDWRGCLYFITRPAKIEGDKDWFCSEAIFSAFLSIGRRLLNNIPPHKVSPTVLLYPTSLQYEKTIYTE